MNYIKPKKLQKGDTVAIVSPSWGGPSIFPHIYENGLKILEKFSLIISYIIKDLFLTLKNLTKWQTLGEYYFHYGNLIKL